MNIEEIITILNKHNLTIADLSQNTSLRSASEEIDNLLQKKREEAVRGFVEAQGNYVFGKKILRERAETYIKEGKQ